MIRGRDGRERDLSVRLTDEELEMLLDGLDALEIIVEAASALSDETTRKYPDVAWPDIRRLRVLLAHGYHRVDAEQVWTIASENVPALAGRPRSG